MTKKELLESMNIPVTKGSLETKKAWLEKAYDYYQKKDDKELARKFIRQFIKR